MSLQQEGNSLPSTLSDIAALSGFAPTAHTGGFINAADPTPSSQSAVQERGGLQTSPNVPKPGTSIDPATGKPHTAGLTRAELEEKKAAAAKAESLGAAAFGGAGGLGSSPNVPAPGTSINPETGKPHTAGLTRAELEAKKAAALASLNSASASAPSTGSAIPSSQPAASSATSGLSPEELEHIRQKGADLLDPAPQAEQARRSSVSQGGLATAGHPRRPSDVSGREQAAKQLAGVYPAGAQSATSGSPKDTSRRLSHLETDGASTAGSSTPGQEMPGGWGQTKPIPLAGSGPNAPTSLYDDVAEGLGKVGQAAFAAIPSPIKERFSSSPTSPSSVTGRRSSATALFDQAKVQASKLGSDLQGTIANTQRRASSSLGADGSFRKQVREFVDEAFNSTSSAAGPTFGFVPAAGAGAPSIGIAPRFSSPRQSAGTLPSETEGQKGVAALPKETKPVVPETNQGPRPGEFSPVLGASSQAGPSGTSGTDAAAPAVGEKSIVPSSSTAADPTSESSGLSVPGVASLLAAPAAAAALLPSFGSKDDTPSTFTGTATSGTAPATLPPPQHTEIQAQRHLDPVTEATTPGTATPASAAAPGGDSYLASVPGAAALAAAPAAIAEYIPGLSQNPVALQGVEPLTTPSLSGPGTVKPLDAGASEGAKGLDTAQPAGAHVAQPAIGHVNSAIPTELIPDQPTEAGVAGGPAAKDIDSTPATGTAGTIGTTGDSSYLSSVPGAATLAAAPAAIAALVPGFGDSAIKGVEPLTTPSASGPGTAGPLDTAGASGEGASPAGAHVAQPTSSTLATGTKSVGETPGSGVPTGAAAGTKAGDNTAGATGDSSYLSSVPGAATLAAAPAAVAALVPGFGDSAIKGVEPLTTPSASGPGTSAPLDTAGATGEGASPAGAHVAQPTSNTFATGTKSIDGVNDPSVGSSETETGKKGGSVLNSVPGLAGLAAAPAAAAALVSGSKEKDNVGSDRGLDSTGSVGGASGITDSTTTGTGSHGTTDSHLAPALPASGFGLGAPVGSHSISSSRTPTAPGSSTTLSTVNTSPTSGTSAAGTAGHGRDLVPDTRYGNERTNSTASVTAIAHGHEGSPLARGTVEREAERVEKEKAGTGVGSTPAAGEEESHKGRNAALGAGALGAGAAGARLAGKDKDGVTQSGEGQKSTTRGTGVNHTTSLTPGNEHEGVGHPASRDVAGASREPGSYPSADHARETTAPGAGAKYTSAGATSGPGDKAAEAGVVGGTGTAAGAAALISHDKDQKQAEETEKAVKKATPESAGTTGATSGATGAAPTKSTSATAPTSADDAATTPSNGNAKSSTGAATAGAAGVGAGAGAGAAALGHKSNPSTSTTSHSDGPRTPTTPTTPSRSTSGAAAGAGTTPVQGSGHNRTGSSASGGTPGKKVGFMKKLKGEIKVIGGKLQNDDKKVALGEKIKHGEA
ncbi:hypothetical protein IAT38_007055 [Cryptococcus sp. DSM 104549]